MMSFSYKTFLRLSLLLLWLFTPLTAQSHQPSPENLRRVLVVHSYDPTYRWVASVNVGLWRTLHVQSLELEFFYMDTKRRSDPAWKKARGEKALEVIEEWKPELVVLVDDNAQEFVGRHLVGRESPNVVFCGVNADPKIYGYPAKNVTGVLERPHLEQTISHFRILKPEAKKFDLLMDYSTTSSAVLKSFKEQGSTRLLHAVTQARTFEEWKQFVQESQNLADALITYTYHTVTQDAERVPPAEVMRWTVEHSKIPVLGLLVFSVDDGALGGVVELGAEQGRAAAELANEVLHGLSPQKLPFTSVVLGQTMVSSKAAKRWGIQLTPELRRTVDIVIGEGSD